MTTCECFDGPRDFNHLAFCPARGERERERVIIHIQADDDATSRALAPSIKQLIENSSIGAGLRDIKERGIEAHLQTLDEETRPKRRRKRR